MKCLVLVNLLLVLLAASFATGEESASKEKEPLFPINKPLTLWESENGKHKVTSFLDNPFSKDGSYNLGYNFNLRKRQIDESDNEEEISERGLIDKIRPYITHTPPHPYLIKRDWHITGGYSRGPHSITGTISRKGGNTAGNIGYKYNFGKRDIDDDIESELNKRELAYNPRYGPYVVSKRDWHINGGYSNGRHSVTGTVSRKGGRTSGGLNYKYDFGKREIDDDNESELNKREYAYNPRLGPYVVSKRDWHINGGYSNGKHSITGTVSRKGGRTSGGLNYKYDFGKREIDDAIEGELNKREYAYNPRHGPYVVSKRDWHINGGYSNGRHSITGTVSRKGGRTSGGLNYKYDLGKREIDDDIENEMMEREIAGHRPGIVSKREEDDDMIERGISLPFHRPPTFISKREEMLMDERDLHLGGGWTSSNGRHSITGGLTHGAGGLGANVGYTFRFGRDVREAPYKRRVCLGTLEACGGSRRPWDRF